MIRSALIALSLIHISGVSDKLLSRKEDLFAVVTDVPLDVGVPLFNPENSADIVGLVNLIEKKFLG